MLKTVAVPLSRNQRTLRCFTACLSLVFGIFTLPLRPVSAASGASKRGADLFATRGCSHCHGADGEGTDTGPPLRSVRTHLTAAQIRQQIRNGGQAMPAFGDILDGPQIEDLVAFLRARSWPAPPVGAPPLH